MKQLLKAESRPVTIMLFLRGHTTNAMIHLLIKLIGFFVLVVFFCPVSAISSDSGMMNKSFAFYDPVYNEDYPDSGALQFSYGINFGIYFANNATANYYNGSGRNNLVETITRQHTYYRIRESLGGYDFEFPGDPADFLPQNMSYNPAMMVGVFGMIHFNQRTSLHAEFNFSRLRLQDQFMMRIIKGDPGFIGHDIERFNILGTEERSDIKLGLQQIYRSPRNEVHPYVELGFNMINTRVKENRVQIAGSSYSILNLTDRRYGFRDDGISFGAYAGGGLRIDLGRSNALTIGALANYASINLGDYDKYVLHYSFFVRLFLNAGSELSVTD